MRKKIRPPLIEVVGFETRRYPRFHIHLPVEYQQTKSSFTHTGNVSENGLLVYLPEGMDVSQNLRLKVFFHLDSELNTIKTLAEVVWKDRYHSDNLEYNAHGVKFLHVSPEDKTKLRNFLKSISSPMDDILSLFNIVEVKLWIRKRINISDANYFPPVSKFDGS